MRGRQLHNYLCREVIALLTVLGFQVATERRFCGGQVTTDVDIWVVRECDRLAAEIETTCRSALRNLGKAHLVPCDCYVVVVPTAALARLVRDALSTAQITTIQPPLICTLSTLQQRVVTVFRRHLSTPTNGNRKGELQ